ncbi:MAG: hypothetical protein ACP5MZ_04555, partial [Candidatus Micrarchaeia archaeon]
MSRTSASAAAIEKDAEPQGSMSIEGVVLDIDYAAINGKVVIRVTVKGLDGKAYDLIDDEFRPYFYFVPSGEANGDSILNMRMNDGGRNIAPIKVEEDEKSFFGKRTKLFRIYMETPSDIPKFS